MELWKVGWTEHSLLSKVQLSLTIPQASVGNMTERTRSKVDADVFGDVVEDFQTGKAFKKKKKNAAFLMI